MNYELYDFVSDLVQSATADQTGQRFINFAQRTGACVVHIFFGRSVDCRTFSTLPKSFITAEVATPSNRDEHVVRAVQSGVPRVLWGLDLDDLNPGANAVGRASNIRRFENFQQRSSVTFSMPNKDGSFSGAGIGIGYEERGVAFQRRMDGSGGILALAAYAAYSQMVQLAENEIAPSPLSKRQAEILLLLANGHKLGEIADKLNISDSAVNQYLANLRRKLNARTKEEALAKAVMNGWITP